MIPVSLRTGRSALELCEIEEQGGLIVDSGTRLYAPEAEGRPTVAASPF
jgi:predicted sugar kinase